MGGEGPYVKFESDRTSWHVPGPMKKLGANEVAAAYARAHRYLLDRVNALRQEFGWKDADVLEEGLLAHVEKGVVGRYHGPQNINIRLPCLFSDFFEPDKPTYGRKVFSLTSAFKAQRSRSSSDYLYIEAARPAADIFNMMQCIAPGMLQIIRVDEIDDWGEETTIRMLPPSAWVEENKSALEEILGNATFGALQEASQSSGMTTKFGSCMFDQYDRYDRYGYGEDSECLDFTACDKECGYCGRCPY